MKIKKRRRIKRDCIKPNTWLFAEDTKEWIKLPYFIRRVSGR